MKFRQKVVPLCKFNWGTGTVDPGTTRNVTDAIQTT